LAHQIRSLTLLLLGWSMAALPGWPVGQGTAGRAQGCLYGSLSRRTRPRLYKCISREMLQCGSLLQVEISLMWKEAGLPCWRARLHAGYARTGRQLRPRTGRTHSQCHLCWRISRASQKHSCPVPEITDTLLRSKWAAGKARGGSVSQSIRDRRATPPSAHFHRNPSGRSQLAVFRRCSLDPYQ